MKGAALAGALAEAERRGVRPVAAGGSSAGAIVALLCALRLPSELVKQWLLDLDSTQLFPKPEDASELNAILGDVADLAKTKFSAIVFWQAFKFRENLRRLKDAAERIYKHKGLYDLSGLERKLAGFVAHKFSWSEEDAMKLTFGDLEQRTGVNLRVLVADVNAARAVVLPRSRSSSDLVVPAVAASACFPIVFQPMIDPLSRSAFVDGGLASNLPVFLFDDYLERRGVPTFAFGLEAKSDMVKAVGSASYFGGLIDTALGAHDEVMRSVMPGVYYCPLKVPADVKTLDFGASRVVKSDLYGCGVESASMFFAGFEPLRRLASPDVGLYEHLRSTHGDRSVIETALSGFVAQVEALSGCVDVRVSIMLPTGRGTRMVVYSYGFEGCSDEHLELGNEEGVSGAAHSREVVAIADLTRGEFRVKQDGKVHKEAKTMMSLPIFANEADEARVVGTLNIDTPVAVALTGWDSENFVRVVSEWTWVVASLFRPWSSPRDRDGEAQ
jgi:NTE family protein